MHMNQTKNTIALTRLTIVVAILALSNFFLSNGMSDNQHVQSHTTGATSTQKPRYVEPSIEMLQQCPEFNRTFPSVRSLKELKKAPRSETAIFWAVESNLFGPTPELIQELVKNGFNINHPNAEGLTPLLSAVGNACRLDAFLCFMTANRIRSMLRELLNQGADKTIKDRNGRTPLYYVQEELNTVQSKIDSIKIPNDILWKLNARGYDRCNYEEQAILRDELKKKKLRTQWEHLVRLKKLLENEEQEPKAPESCPFDYGLDTGN